MQSIPGTTYKVHKPVPTMLTMNYALFYSSLGFSVIPLARKSKRPIVKWKQYQARSPSHAELTEWFSGLCNIGVVTGTVSGNLAVLDFDDNGAYEKFFKPDIESRTLVVKPSKGRHVYLRSMEPVESFRIMELKLDVKAEGSYVVAPPSVHPDGQVYNFVDPEVKEVMLVENLEELIWRYAVRLGVKKPFRKLRDIEEKTSISKKHYRGEDPVCIKAVLCGVGGPKGKEAGRRDEAAVRLARYLHIERALSAEETLRRLLKWNEKNSPPIGQYRDDSRDLERYFIEKIRSAEKSRRFGCASLSRVAGICSGRDQCEFFSFNKRRRRNWLITIYR